MSEVPPCPFMMVWKNPSFMPNSPSLGFSKPRCVPWISLPVFLPAGRWLVGCLCLICASCCGSFLQRVIFCVLPVFSQAFLFPMCPQGVSLVPAPFTLFHLAGSRPYFVPPPSGVSNDPVFFWCCLFCCFPPPLPNIKLRPLPFFPSLLYPGLGEVSLFLFGVFFSWCFK